MDREFKNFVENNFDFLVKLYNRYIRYCLRDSSSIEYYASPYMNLVGYPSDKFMFFCIKYYNKKYNKNLDTNIIKENIIINIYLYLRLVLFFLLSSVIFNKKIKKNSVVIHSFHTDSDFKNNPYTTIKSPPLEYFENKNIYHDINISFISLKSILKYKNNNIVCSLNNLSVVEFITLHYQALKIYIQSKKINLFPISYVHIIYVLVKGISISKLINNLDNDSKYLHMFEKRGYHLIADFLILNHKKSLFLDLGISFRMAPEYMMFNYTRHILKSEFIFMSNFNYKLLKNNLKNIKYKLFKNYRIDCTDYKSEGKKNNILLVSPLSVDVTNKLYKLLVKNKNKKLNIRIRLHPFLNKNNFDVEHIEERGIYESLDDYDTVIYAGTTTAAIELYFQGKKVYKFISNEFLDIDPLVDYNLVKKIVSLADMEGNNRIFTEDEKEYYLGCNNKNLKEILEELD